MTARALVNFGLIIRDTNIDNIPSDILEFYSEKMPDIKRNRMLFSSPYREIEFDDLGVRLLEYCKGISIPNFLVLDKDYTAYLQVVPETQDDLRVFLDAEFLKLLTEKGLGLDIHQQCSSPLP